MPDGRVPGERELRRRREDPDRDPSRRRRRTRSPRTRRSAATACRRASGTDGAVEHDAQRVAARRRRGPRTRAARVSSVMTFAAAPLGRVQRRRPRSSAGRGSRPRRSRRAPRPASPSGPPGPRWRRVSPFAGVQPRRDEQRAALVGHRVRHASAGHSCRQSGGIVARSPRAARAARRRLERLAVGDAALGDLPAVLVERVAVLPDEQEPPVVAHRHDADGRATGSGRRRRCPGCRRAGRPRRAQTRSTGSRRRPARPAAPRPDLDRHVVGRHGMRRGVAVRHVTTVAPARVATCARAARRHQEWAVAVRRSREGPVRRWLIVIASRASLVGGAAIVLVLPALQVYDELSAVSGVCHPHDAAEHARGVHRRGPVGGRGRAVHRCRRRATSSSPRATRASRTSCSAPGGSPVRTRPAPPSSSSTAATAAAGTRTCCSPRACCTATASACC